MKAHLLAPVPVIIRGWARDRLYIEPVPGLVLELERDRTSVQAPLEVGGKAVLEAGVRPGECGRPARQYVISPREKGDAV